MSIRATEIWCVDFREPSRWLSSLAPHELLPTEDLARASACVEKRKNEILIVQSVLRVLLSQYFPGTAPRDWQIARTPEGKPFFAGAAPCVFSLAHSHGIATLAFGAAGELGVDVEKVNPSRDLAEIAASVFTKEEIEAMSKPDGAIEPRNFFEIWALKEAYVKAVGRGLSFDLKSVSFRIDPAGPVASNASGWQLALFEPVSGYQAAVASFCDRTPSLEVRQRGFFETPLRR